MGVFLKEKDTGAFIDSWKALVKSVSFDNIDVSGAVARIMSPKENDELLTIKKSRCF